MRATARILVKHGYDATNTNRVAEAAGVSIGSLYQYFPSKEALVAELIERHSEAMWRLCLERTSSVVGRPLDEAAREVIGAIFAAHAVEPKLHKVLHEQVPRVGKLSRVDEVNRRCEQLVHSYLLAYPRRDELAVTDLELAAFVITQTVTSLAHGALERPELLRSGRLQEETALIVLRYLKDGEVTS